MPNTNKLIIDLTPSENDGLNTNESIKLIITGNPRDTDGKITLKYFIDSFLEANTADSVNVIAKFNGADDIINIYLAKNTTSGSFSLNIDDTTSYLNGFEISSYNITINGGIIPPAVPGGDTNPVDYTLWSKDFTSDNNNPPYKLYDVPPPTLEIVGSSDGSERYIEIGVTKIEGASYKSFYRKNNVTDYTDGPIYDPQTVDFMININNLTPATGYTIKVLATIGLNSSESIITFATGIIPFPTNFSGSANTNNVTLSWTKAGSVFATSLQLFYILYKSTNGGTTWIEVINGIDKDTTTFSFAGLTYIDHKFKLNSIIDGFESKGLMGDSNEQIITVGLVPPSAPETPIIQAGDKQIVVTPITFSGGNAYGPFTIVMTPTLSELGVSTFAFRTGYISKPYAAYNNITPTGLLLMITYNQNTTFIKSTELVFSENGSGQFILASGSDTNTFTSGLAYKITLNVMNKDQLNSDIIWTGELSNYIPRPSANTPATPIISISNTFVTEQEIVVDITNVNTNASYISFYKKQSDSNYTNGPSPTSNSFIFRNLIPDKVYNFRVIATVNNYDSEAGEISYNTKIVPPPQSLSANLSNDIITLTWTAPTTSNTSYTYNLYKQIDSGSWTSIQAAINKNTLTLNFVPGLVYGVYKFKIESVIADILSVPVESSTVNVSCLLKGTKVKTPNGYRNIETLKVGDSVISHRGKTVKIIKAHSWYIKWSNNLNPESRVYVLEKNGKKVYLSEYHKYMISNGENISNKYKLTTSMVQACEGGLRLARKEEICDDNEMYQLYNIQVENHERNHLIINGGIIVESWDGKLSEIKLIIG